MKENIQKRDFIIQGKWHVYREIDKSNVKGTNIRALKIAGSISTNSDIFNK